MAPPTMQEEEHPINSKGWMDVYPRPMDRLECPLLTISVEELSAEMDKGCKAGKDFLVVDVRRNDCLSMIPDAINYPAQSFNASLPSLVQVLAPIPLVIFHCSRSKGRGPRAAGWYADALQKHLDLTDKGVSTRVRVLLGGIDSWETQFGQGSLMQRGVKEGKKTVQL